MTPASPPSNNRAQLRDWLRGAIVWGFAPGWVLSLIFHATMFGTIVSLTQMPSCRGDYSGEDGTGFREIGLRTREDANSAPSAGAEAPGMEAETATTTSLPTSTPAVTQVAPPTISEVPPVPLNLPNFGAAPAVIGIGPPPLTGVAGAPPVPATLNSSGEGSPGSRGGGGGQGNAPGQTSLYGVSDTGKKFVYVIDRSSSMDEFGALRAAKSELLTSLSRLTEVQQFQVIFYNNAPTTLATRDDRHRMFFGTDAQRLQVSEQLRGIGPEGGTRHLPAVQEALKLNPDVIFLLTDGGTSLERDEVAKITSQNRQGTRIHCIEFGKDPPPMTAEGQAVQNSLKKLADLNSGKYTYRDMKLFRVESP